MNSQIHGPNDGHDHGTAVTAGNERRIRLVFIFTAGYAAVQAIGGWLSGSLALIADSGHMVSDAAALLLALIAYRVARRPADNSRTYGFHRVRVLAALAQDAVLHADGGGKKLAVFKPILGSDRIARFFAGLSSKRGGQFLDAVVTRLNGMPGVLATEIDGLPRSTTLEVRDGRITAIYIVRNPDKLRHVAALAPPPSVPRDDAEPR